MRDNNDDFALLSIDTDEARGGVTGHNVRYVLGGSLALVVICFMTLAALF
jgi:hypothetical protein